MFRSYKLLQAREYPHNIGDVGVHVVHAVDIQRARTPRLPPPHRPLPARPEPRLWRSLS